MYHSIILSYYLKLPGAWKRDPRSHWTSYVFVRPFLVLPHGVFLDHVQAAAGFCFA